MQTYTYSVTELKNDRFRNGEWFYADWDRRHSFNTVATYNPLPRLDLSINWVYSNGRPDQLTVTQAS